MSKISVCDILYGNHATMRSPKTTAIRVLCSERRMPTHRPHDTSTRTHTNHSQWQHCLHTKSYILHSPYSILLYTLYMFNIHTVVISLLWTCSSRPSDWCGGTNCFSWLITFRCRTINIWCRNHFVILIDSMRYTINTNNNNNKNNTNKQSNKYTNRT